MAALDHNSNVARDNAVTRDGKLQFRHQFSKAAKQYVAVQQRKEKAYNFRQEIMVGIANRCREKTIQEMLRENEKCQRITLGQHRGIEKPDKGWLLSISVASTSKWLQFGLDQLYFITIFF